MPKLVVQHATDEGDFEDLCERTYEQDVRLPENGEILHIPGHEDEEGELKQWFVENRGHLLEEDEPKILLIVRDAEQVRRQIQERRKQELRQMQQMQKGGGGGGRGGGGGGGQGGGQNSPFTLG